MIRQAEAAKDEAIEAGELTSLMLSLPPKSVRDLATELAVISFGPIQPLTAGPLRFH